MTELYVKCKKHDKRVHVKEWCLDWSFFGDCGCEFLYNSGHIRNLTKEREDENKPKKLSEIEDYQMYGARYQDGSREKEGIMLQDGSYI